MIRNILLTSLDTPESGNPLWYYSAQNEFSFSYCEARQCMEASAKYVLARFPIDEILVIGNEADPDGGKPFRLKDATAPDPADPKALSAIGLYRSRLAQYINELNPEEQAYDALLPEEQRLKLIEFIRGFLEQYSEQETKRLNRFFDELSRNRPLYEKFKDALFDTFPEARQDSRQVMKWVKNYLYMQLKPTAKLEVLPVNENITVRYLSSCMLENRDYWMNSALGIDQDVLDGKDKINLFVSIGNNSAMNAHLTLNTLDILVATPGSNVHLKKIYEVSNPSGNLTGKIRDTTAVTLTTNLAAAAHAFLNYSKTDMLVNFWENCGGQNERVSRLIYAARHVDTGISMCNIMEVQEGIQQLRRLFSDERSWLEEGDYGLLFGVIAGCIQADYRTLLEDDSENYFIRLIKWAYQHHLYQQVLTLIETFAPTNLVDSGIFYYCDDEAQADEVIKLFALQRLELKPYEYYKIDENVSHYFVKNYDRASVRLAGSRDEDRNLVYAILRTQSVGNQDPTKITGHTACSSMDTLQNVLYSYYHLGEVRNKISHADAKAMAERRLNVSESDVSYAMVMMKETIEYFITSYDKAIEEVQGKNPKIITVTSDEIRNAANRLKHEGEKVGRPRRQSD